ncbi:MAG: biotin transporter BioY [Clostridia bacterium]|nr:biotin transporter BioY [Clostridia bacterium]
METRRKKLYHIISAALTAGILCVVSPWSIGVGPVPITLCTLFLYLSAYLLSPVWATGAVAGYLALGLIGLPVFSGFGGGIGVLSGPTGGYLLGYLILVPVCALTVSRFPDRRVLHAIGMISGTVLLYLTGTVWFCLLTGRDPVSAIGVCVLPFLPGDALKMIAAVSLGPLLRKRIAGERENGQR